MVVCNIFVIADVAAVRLVEYLNLYSLFLLFLLQGDNLTQNDIVKFRMVHGQIKFLILCP